MNNKENQGLISHINPNQTFLCDINIDNISKDENYLLIKTGNTIKRLKISDIRQAIRLVMETNKHDTKDITSTMEVAEKDMKNNMERIAFNLTAMEKRELKINAMDEDKTLTQYIKDILFPYDYDNESTRRIEEINIILQRNGSTMTKEEREQLKAEREKLRKE